MVIKSGRKLINQMIVILGLLAFQPILVAVFLDDQVVGGLNSVLLLKLD
jgi:hypothetical protein